VARGSQQAATILGAAGMCRAINVLKMLMATLREFRGGYRVLDEVIERLDVIRGFICGYRVFIGGYRVFEGDHRVFKGGYRVLLVCVL